MQLQIRQKHSLSSTEGSERQNTPVPLFLCYKPPAVSFHTMDIRFAVTVPHNNLVFILKYVPKQHSNKSNTITFLWITTNDFFPLIFILHEYLNMFCSHFIFASAEFILKLIPTFRRLRIISKWSSTRSMKRYSCVLLAPLLPVRVSSHRFLTSHIFPPKQNRKTWCVMELQSCQAGEGRQYRVVRHEKNDISVKVRGLPHITPHSISC